MSIIILIRGKAGVGKTMLSNALAKQLKISVLRKDTIYDVLANEFTDHQQTNLLSEKVLLNLIKDHINNGTDVIVDNSYHYPEHYQHFRSWVDHQHAQLKSVLLSCSNESLWKERFEMRQHNPKPNNRITDFNALKKHYGSLETRYFRDELVLDNVGDLNSLVSSIIGWLHHE